MYRSILVPLDGSAFAEQALPHALEIARRSSASVTLARVHLPLAPAFAKGLPPFDYNIESGVRDQALAYVQDLARRRAEERAPVTPLVLEGPVTESICEYARSSGIDLIVPDAGRWRGSGSGWAAETDDPGPRHSPSGRCREHPHDTAQVCLPAHLDPPRRFVADRGGHRAGGHPQQSYKRVKVS